MSAHPRFSEPLSGDRPADAADSTASLLARLLNDASALLRSEVALAKTELSEAAAGAKRGVAGLAVAGGIVFAGFLALLAAAILGLSNVMEPWLAAFVVGLVVCGVGLAMLKTAQRKLSPDAFRLERTQDSLRKDIATARRAT